MNDLISRQAAINALIKRDKELRNINWYDKPFSEGECKGIDYALEIVNALPSAQPFHNITMGEVLKYIDDMPEDVWQEFTACLECRGWELQKRTAKWCGGDFA